MQLNGIVAILDEQGNFVEVRDLGLKPVDIKPGRVIPLEEINKSEGRKPGDVIIKGGKAERVWIDTVVEPEPPSIEDRLFVIEQMLGIKSVRSDVEEGSVKG